ncbi:MAG: dihydrofolate reductase [Candidatus Woesearchaeota archaeon]
MASSQQPRLSLISIMHDDRYIGNSEGMVPQLTTHIAFLEKKIANTPVLLGKQTYALVEDSLAKRRKEQNLVLSKTLPLVEYGIVFPSVDEVLSYGAANGLETIIVLGGEQTFASTIDTAARLYLTIIHGSKSHENEKAKYFPSIQTHAWQNSKWVSYGGYTVAEYERRQKNQKTGV